MKIAFIGLGNMGGGMAANLVKAGHEVNAFDLSEEALATAKSNGCETFADPGEAVQGVDGVVKVVPRHSIERFFPVRCNDYPLAIFFFGQIANLALGALGVLIFSLYLVYDTQLVVGGRHRKFQYGVDDYVFAALSLYLDVINLFLCILAIAKGNASSQPPSDNFSIRYLTPYPTAI